MTHTQAARVQHLRHSFYTVYLIGPNGEREQMAYTQRRSGNGLMTVLLSDRVQARVKLFPNAEALTMTKHKDRLAFSNGWALAFGGTIRQESH